MRLLLANPNTSSEATEALLTLARRSASLGTEIVGATGRFGASLMRSPAERAIGVHALLDAVAENADECDAIVVGAFGDYGSAAAATLLGKPVVNLASAAFTTIKWLARPFSIVTLSQAMANDLRKEADANGAGELLVGIYAVERSPTDPEFRDAAVASVGNIEPLRKLRCSAPRYDPGGGGVNVSRAIRELGGESRAFVAIGGHTGE